jgi:predicted metalloprotease
MTARSGGFPSLRFHPGSVGLERCAPGKSPKLARMRRRLVALLAISLIAAACGSEPGVVATRSDSAGGTPPVTESPTPTEVPGPTTPPESTTPIEPPASVVVPPPADGGRIDMGDAKPPRDYDNYMNAAFADIEAFWAEQYPAVYGSPFEPVAGIYAHYPERTNLPESCEGGVSYDAVAGNAFYTTCGDIIVYDDADLLPTLVEQLGAAAVGVVAAHEYGHAIQARAGVFDQDLPTIATEQQADCFAGAWAAHLARGERDTLSFGDREVKAGLVAMIFVRDEPGDFSQIDGTGHGTAFDRVGAFQEGFNNGVARCADLIANPNPRVDLAFSAGDYAEDGTAVGDLPLADILTLMPESFSTFWVPTLANGGITFTPPTLQPLSAGAAVPTCAGRPPEDFVSNAVFCPDTNAVVYDEAFHNDLLARFGDLAFTYPIANAYGDAVQTALGSALTGERRVLLSDCLVGAWIVDIIPTSFDADGNPVAANPNQTITLSAGDLDEAVNIAVLLGDESSSTDRVGTTFEKIDAFRRGVLGGLGSCQALLG